MSDWVVHLIRESGYLGVGFLMFLETVFPPIPSEIIMSVAGVEASRGTMSLWGVILAGATGAMFGNFFWYLLARAVGLHRLRPLIERFGRWITLDWKEVERAERWFRHYGTAFVCIGRMVPTVRSLVSIPAGLLRMSIRNFLFWSTMGTLGWTALLAGAGYQLGANYAEIDDYIGPLSNAVIAVLVLGYLWRVITWRPSRR